MSHYKEHKSGRMAQHLAENINGRLVVSLRDIGHTMRSFYEGRGSQKRILIVLSETGTVTQRELTRRLGIQPGSASEVIAKLERSGLVERASSPEDRRTANLSLTEEGARQAQAALEQRQRRHEEMFSALTGAEKEQLLSLLEKINTDWRNRYEDQRESSGGRHHGRRGGAFESRADDPDRGHHSRAGAEDQSGRGREARHNCDHDCEHCSHPCVRGRNRQA